MKKFMATVLVCLLILASVGSYAEETDYMAKWNSETQYILDHYLADFEAEGLGEVMSPYEETVTLSIAKRYTAADETRMAIFNARYGETFENNRWNYINEKALNVKFDYKWWALDGSDYNEKLHLEMAAGTIPDVFTASQTDVLQLAEAGMIMDVSDLLEQYASQTLKDIYSSDEGKTLDMVTYNGGVYGIPVRASDTDNFSYLFIRKDWMEKLNLEWPKTIDDLEEIMKEFMAADFDGNGVDDTIGMIVDKDLWYSVRGLCNAYSAYPETWIKTEDGTIAYGATQPEVKEALETLHYFYEAGYIDPEFATKSNSVALQSILNGTCGVVYGGHWTFSTFGDLHELEPESDWACYELPTGNGEPVRSAIKPNCSAWLCINSSCENPEAAIKVINLWNYTFFNANDSSWFSYEENDSRNNIAPINGSVAATDNMDVYYMLQDMYATNDPSVLKGKAIAYWGNLTNPELGWEWAIGFGSGDTAMKVLCDAYDAGNVFYDAFVGPKNELMSERWSTIKGEFLTISTKIILGEIGVDEGFEQWLNTFSALGGDEITAYVNEWMASING